VGTEEDEPLLRKFGKAVRRERERRALSQEALATDADVDRSTVARIELGQFNASLRTVAKLARALGTKPRDLM